MRMLFVTWNDGYPPAQFSLPPGATLEQITAEPVSLDDGAQFLLDATRVRSAYLIDVPDGTVISHVAAIPVQANEPADPDWMLPAEELDALHEDERRDAEHAGT